MSLRVPRHAVLCACAALLLAAPAAASGSKQKTDSPTRTQGNLSIIDLRVHEIATGAGEPRLAIQVLVENQSPESRTAPYQVDVRTKDSKQKLGSCRGETLPQGQVGLCELWLTEGTRQGQVFEATLDRSTADFGTWDADPNDDRRAHEVRTIAEGNQVLRLVSFELVPNTIQGSSPVNFRFQVEGAHLVWLLAEDKPPRLLAGHPSDGLLNGKGKENLSTSGPVTLVARNSFGAFVYQTIPVVNTYEPTMPAWARVPAEQVDGYQTMKVLDPGVYDVDEDLVILDRLRAYLGSKDWAAAVEQMRAAKERENEKPAPASVLNPRTRKPKPAGGTDPDWKR